MATVIQLKDVKAIEPGMVLAEPVFNQFGQMLLAQGTELQPRHLSLLKTWGCQAITILDESREEKGAEVNPETIKRAFSRVHWRMKWEPATVLEKEIQQLALRQVIQKFLCS